MTCESGASRPRGSDVRSLPSAVRVLIAAVVLGCAGAPPASPAPIASPSQSPAATIRQTAPATGATSLAYWVAGWKPQLVAFVQARKTFTDIVSKRSATYAEVGRAAQDLAGSAQSLRDAIAAALPPPEFAAEAESAVRAADAAVAVLHNIAALCGAAGAAGCASSINDAWPTADAALTKALAPFLST